MVPLKATEPEVYITATPTIISDSNDALEETINNLKIIKLRIYMEDNNAYFCNSILVDDECPEITK